jgi:hypothetical protein
MACHHVKDPETGMWVHIPECYGAINDPDGCTCEIKGSDLEQAIFEKEEAQRRAEACLQSAQSVREQNVRISVRNSELRQRITELKQGSNQPQRKESP